MFPARATRGLVRGADRCIALADTAGQERIATAAFPVVVVAVHKRTASEFGERGEGYVHP